MAAIVPARSSMGKTCPVQTDPLPAIQPSPTPDPLDSRICAAALQVPWNNPLMASLTRDPQTPIQDQARTTYELFQEGADADPVSAWHLLSRLCVDAGY